MHYEEARPMTGGLPPSAPASGGLQSIVRAWPSYLMTVIVALAGAYAFSPRPVVTYQPAPIKPNQILVTGLAQSGGHIVAAGELGHILLSDSPTGPWNEATIE